jgi:hypothetical protein
MKPALLALAAMTVLLGASSVYGDDDSAAAALEKLGVKIERPVIKLVLDKTAATDADLKFVAGGIGRRSQPFVPAEQVAKTRTGAE